MTAWFAGRSVEVEGDVVVVDAGGGAEVNEGSMRTGLVKEISPRWRS